MDYFKAEDFQIENVFGDSKLAIEQKVAMIANEKLYSLIQLWPKYYCKESLGTYHTFTIERFKDSTHIFRIAFIEPIVKEQCKHRVKQMSWVEENGVELFHARCEMCGAELISEWKVKT